MRAAGRRRSLRLREMAARSPLERAQLGFRAGRALARAAPLRARVVHAVEVTPLRRGVEVGEAEVVATDALGLGLLLLLDVLEGAVAHGLVRARAKVRARPRARDKSGSRWEFAVVEGEG